MATNRNRNRNKKKKATQSQVEQENRQIAEEEKSDIAAGERMVSQLPLARTAEEQSILDMRRAEYERAGQETPEQKATREKLEASTGNVYDPMKDAQVQALLQKHVAGLEGANAAENQALRAQMIRSEQAGTASALRGMKAMGGTMGITGRAGLGATGGIYRNAMIARALGESDLTAKNIQLKQQALSNYTGALSGFTGQSLQAGEETGRRLGTLSGYQLGTSKILSDAQQAAADAYSTDTLGLGQAEREGWIQSYLGGQGLNIARRGSLRGEKLGKEGLALAKSAYNY